MNKYLFTAWLSTIIIGLCMGDGHLPTPPSEAPKCGYSCMNGAQCMWPGYGEEYRCICPDGFTGMFCETEIPDCNNGDVCYNNGLCRTYGDGEFFCDCPAPYTGYQCETEMTDCSDQTADSQCLNGGSCQAMGDEHFCMCPLKYTGYRCETKLPDCDSCHPEAEACMMAPCECQGDCEGQPPVSTSKPTVKCGYGCMNGAECMWPGYGEEFHCQCPEGFTGMFCETEIPDCSKGDMCHNNGECKMEYDEYFCECPYPFTGYQCEIEMKDCRTGDHDSMCKNGGVCETYGNEAWCNCQYPFTGYQCETAMPLCESCHPQAAPCYAPPCECQGQCPMMTMCASCLGSSGSPCSKPTENDNIKIEVCEYGCHTKTWMINDRWYIQRGCATVDCWSGCNENEECTECCYGDHCNIRMDHGVIGAAPFTAPQLAVTVIISLFGLMALF
ncbi:delta-like protein 1 isoform X2 [Ptychodera flava]